MDIRRYLPVLFVAAAWCARGSDNPRPTADAPLSAEDQAALDEVGELINEMKHAEAAKEARELIARVEAAHGPDSLQAVAVVDWLVRAATPGREDLPELRRRAEAALAVRERVLGPEHPDVAIGLCTLATVIRRLEGGEGQSEYDLYERALAIREKALGPDHLDVAWTLDELAMRPHTMGDYAGANAFYRRALAIREKALGPDHVEVAQSLTVVGMTSWRAGDFPAAKSLLERALVVAERALGAQHEDLAYYLVGVAHALGVSGDAAAGRPLIERALSLQERAWGPDDRRLELVLGHLTRVLSDLGEHAEARKVEERRLALLQRSARGPNDATIASSLQRLAGVLQALGDYAGARPLMERAVAIFEQAYGPEDRSLAVALNGLAVLLREMGDLAAAKPAQERALAILETFMPPDHPEIGTALNNLGVLRSAMGDAAVARHLYERALAIAETAHGPNHSAVATSLNNLAMLAIDTGDHAASKPLLERALAIYEKAHGPEHPRTALALSNLAQAHRHLREHAVSRQLQERALAIREKALGADHPDTASSLALLAGLLHDMGELQAAIPHLERALRIRETTFGVDHPDVDAARAALASFLREARSPGQALELALRAEEGRRNHLRLTQRVLSERAALQHAAARAGGLDTILALVADGIDDVPRGNARAWDALVRSRALVLDEVARRHRAVRGPPEAALAWSKVASARQRLANLVVRGFGALSPEKYRALVEDVSREKEEAEAVLAAASADFRRERAQADAGLDEVLAALPANTALVAFARFRFQPLPVKGAPPPAVVSTFLAFVADGARHRVAAVALGPCTEIGEAVTCWRDAVEDDDAGRIADAGDALRRHAWDPLVPHLGGATRAFVVPDGSLNLVDFASLPTEDGRYLVEIGPTLHYLSAERDVVALPEAPPLGRDLLALGGPDYEARSLFASLASREPEAPTGLLGQVAALLPFRGQRSSCGDFHDLRFRQLPGTVAEVHDVVKLWKAAAPDARASVLSGLAGHEAALKRRAPGYRVIHLATHGLFLGGTCSSTVEATRGVATTGAANPTRLVPVAGESPLLLSGLALAGANHRDAAGVEEEDGVLTAEEVAALELSSVEWAVLSACETGLRDVRSGEGVLDLRRAFQVAGARTIIMSLWAVEDAAAHRFMRALYAARLQQGFDAPASVRQASLELLRARRAKGLPTHPRSWSGFVATGDWH